MTEDFSQQVVIRDMSQFDKCYLVPLADFHEGARDADHEKSDGYIEWIAEHDDALALLNGDMLNCATKDSAPDLFEDLVTPDESYKRLLKRLTPIKDKIILITRGGHEEQIFRKVGHDYMAQLACDLGDIPYHPDGAMFGIRLCRDNHSVIFWGYATHGWGGARTIGAKIKKVEDLANVISVDIVILSHDHTQAIHRLNVLTPPGSNTKRFQVHWTFQRKILINTGGFIQYAGYIQRKGYQPQDLGTPRIRLEIKRSSSRSGRTYMKDLHASI